MTTTISRAEMILILEVVVCSRPLLEAALVRFRLILHSNRVSTAEVPEPGGSSRGRRYTASLQLSSLPSIHAFFVPRTTCTDRRPPSSHQRCAQKKKKTALRTRWPTSKREVYSEPYQLYQWYCAVLPTYGSENTSHRSQESKLSHSKSDFAKYLRFSLSNLIKKAISMYFFKLAKD